MQTHQLLRLSHGSLLHVRHEPMKRRTIKSFNSAIEHTSCFSTSNAFFKESESKATKDNAKPVHIPLKGAEKILVLPYIRSYGSTNRFWFRKFANEKLKSKTSSSNESGPQNENNKSAKHKPESNKPILFNRPDSTGVKSLLSIPPKIFHHASTDPSQLTVTPTSLRKPLLTSKRMSQSYIERYIPIKSNPDCIEEYVNPWGAVRMGKIFEELDALSGSVACLHSDVGVLDASALENAITIVTASLDRITMLKPITADMDLKISGFVFWVGSSSMLVRVTVEEVPDSSLLPKDPLLDMHVSDGLYVIDYDDDSFLYNSDRTSNKSGHLLLSSVFTMVTRDQITSKATPVNPLNLVLPAEKQLFKRGTDHKEKQKLINKDHKFLKLPSQEEYQQIQIATANAEHFSKDYHPFNANPIPTHTINGDVPFDAVHSKDTVQHSLNIMMPQERNIHGNIFGGYLLREAYELAHGTGLQFVHKLQFLSLDDTIFQKPVTVGSLLHLESEIVYSEDDKFLIRVQADVTSPEEGGLRGKRETTNVFHFTFSALDQDGNPLKVPFICPSNLLSLSRWVDGKRQMEKGRSTNL